MENIQCPKCGTFINEGEKFCKKCGEKTIYFKENSPKKEISNKNKIIIIGVSVAAIIILAAMGIIISRNNSEKTNKESTKIETTENIPENTKTEEQVETENFIAETPAMQQNNEPSINQENNIQENVVSENKSQQVSIQEQAVSDNLQKQENSKNEPQKEVSQKEVPVPVQEQKEEYVKYTMNGNVYQSPFCDFSYTSPAGWTILSEQQIAEIIAPPTEKSIYEFVTQDNENGILLKVLVEKTDNANMTVRDYINYINVSVKSSGMNKISDNKTKDIAGKTYNILELGQENSETRINCYIRKKDDRMICIMATYSVGKEEILERDMSYFKEF